MIRLLFTIALLGSCLGAQLNTVADVEKAMPPIKVATKAGPKGEQVWDKSPHQNCPACKAKKKVKCVFCASFEDHELKKCVFCNKTRKANCNYCQGTGALADPLKKAICPGCFGYGVLACGFCANQGSIFPSNAGKKGVKCPACKGYGGNPCQVCSGKGLVNSSFKGKVGKQSLKKLQKARKTLTDLIRHVESFEPKGIAKVDRKKFESFFKHVKGEFPELKKVKKFVVDVCKRVHQPQYKDNDKAQQHAWRRSKGYLLYYLVHQRKVVDVCIARLEGKPVNPAPAQKK